MTGAIYVRLHRDTKDALDKLAIESGESFDNTIRRLMKLNSVIRRTGPVPGSKRVVAVTVASRADDASASQKGAPPGKVELPQKPAEAVESAKRQHRHVKMTGSGPVTCFGCADKEWDKAAEVPAAKAEMTEEEEVFVNALKAAKGTPRFEALAVPGVKQFGRDRAEYLMGLVK